MTRHGLLGALVIGASLVLAAVSFALVNALLDAAGETQAEATLARLDAQGADQAGAIAALRAEVAALARRIDASEARRGFDESPPAPPPGPISGPLPADQFGGRAPEIDDEGIVDPMTIAKDRFNRTVARPTPALLRELLGEPRASYGETCQPVTGPRLLAALDTREIGNFRVTMLRPALDSFARVMAKLQAGEPSLHAALGTAGALCARHVRGAPGVVSSHAWGVAVDLTLTGDLDQMGDDATQFGLVVLAEHFNAAGWYWGAGYGREDSMHFEVGEELLRRWAAEGLI